MMGRNPKWDKFAELTARCYKAVENGNALNECWHNAFAVLMEIIEEERRADNNFARELGDLEKLTDFKFNIEGLILDYLDRLWRVCDYEKICTSGDRIISAFDWNIESSSAIRIKVVNALIKMGKKDEAERYCLEWMQAEPEDVNAVIAKKALLPNEEGDSIC